MHHSSQSVRGQVRDPHPRQYQKTRIVCDTANVAPPRLRTPTDVAVAAAEMTWRRTRRQTRDRPGTQRAPRPHDILQMLADRLLIAQIVMVPPAFFRHLHSGSFRCETERSRKAISTKDL